MNKKQILIELYYRSCRMIEFLHDTCQDDDPKLVNNIYKFHHQMVKRLSDSYPGIATYYIY